MTKVKMVKCMLRSPGEAPAVRFIPLREFQLWRYYMTHAHEKIVEGQEISIWVDARSYSEKPPVQAHPLELVVRVEVQYWDRALHTAALVQRYFPQDEYTTIRDVFLGHYPDVPVPDGRTFVKKRFTETRGYYIHPRLPEIREDSEAYEV
ncbi:MAG: hypothetical protein ACRD21_22250 [Vicinamibacteria bacterium]